MISPYIYICVCGGFYCVIVEQLVPTVHADNIGRPRRRPAAPNDTPDARRRSDGNIFAGEKAATLRSNRTCEP